MRKSRIILLTITLLVSTYVLKSQNTVTLPGLLKSMEQWNRLYRVSTATDSVYWLMKSNIKEKIDIVAQIIVFLQGFISFTGVKQNCIIYYSLGIATL